MLFTNLTIGGFLEEQAKADPERDFLIYPEWNLRYTYREFDERVDKMARGLLSVGLKKGDHMGVWALNVPEWTTLMFASARIGVVLVTVNTSYKSAELAYVMKQSDMKALALMEGHKDVNYIETVNELLPELREQAPGELCSEFFPGLKNIIFMGGEEHPGMYRTSDLPELGKDVSDEELSQVKSSLQSHDAINIQYTSGTTGFPKGVMLTHGNILNNGYYLGEGQGLTKEDRLCLSVPLFHCFGCVLGVLAFLTHGATMVILKTFNPLQALRTIEEEKCTAMYGVPTMFIAMLSHSKFSDFDLSTLRTGIMAGAPCPQETMKQVISKMHCSEMTLAYGLTEASPGISQTSTDDTLERRVGTVGTTLPAIEVKILDPQAGETLGPNQQGELCCRGYNVMKGYYNMPEATSEAIDENGWLHSGDLATCDEHGYYRITGRIKDMIIQGGENIYPRELEEYLHTMPEVENVQVVGVPHKLLGEVAGAFIILKEGVEISKSDVHNFYKAGLARFKIPRHVFFVDAYPLTASGKVQKYKLREIAKERLGITKDIF
ncbi:AMP-binding protein [Candidatus Hydrogenedentota bacterium]